MRLSYLIEAYLTLSQIDVTVSSMSTYCEEYGPWALITGATQGIGLALAKELAQKGFSLVLVARRGQVLEDLAHELTAKNPEVKMLVLALDLGKRDQVNELVSRTQNIDIGLMIHSAGFGSSGALTDNEIENEINLVEVNCISALALCHAFATRFRSRKRSGILLMSSLVGFQGVPYAANYAASKAYVQSLGEALHFELKPWNIDVLLSAPGPVNSGFAERARMTMGLAAGPEEVARKTLAQLGKRVTVRPGWLAWLLEWSLKLTGSRWGRIQVMSRVMRGMAGMPPRA
jgi:short-subunit dehydrogenase